MKQLFWIIVKILLALFMVYAGIQHFVKPEVFQGFVPSFLPYPTAIIYISGCVEIILGISLLLRKDLAKLGALGVFLLMVLFLPIHIFDVFSETPAIGSQKAALIRLVLQFVLIGITWRVYKEVSIKKQTEF